MIATACRYAVPNIRALVAILRDDARHDRWSEYVADMSCVIAKRLSRKWDFPLYSDLTRHASVKADSRSGQEIVRDIIAKRRRKRNAGGGE